MATIHDIMLDLLMNVNDDADVTFVVHGEEVKAHKCIIRARSDFFKAMFQYPQLALADGRHLINDPDITVGEFKEFIKFMYQDRCDVTYENIVALKHMGEMYMVAHLLTHCNRSPMVQQNFSTLADQNKYDRLIELLREDKVAQTLVYFNNTGDSVRNAYELKRRGLKIEFIHGKQGDILTFDEPLQRFRSRKTQILCCTDFYSTDYGFKVEHIINWDMPTDIGTYIRRIGRFGRVDPYRRTVMNFIIRGQPILQEIVAMMRANGEDICANLRVAIGEYDHLH